MGASTKRTPPRVYLQDEERATADRLLSRLSSGSPLIAFHLGAGFPSKRLPVAKFHETARRLCRGEAQCLVVGGQEDEELAGEFARALPFEVTDLTGRLSFLETAAVLERCHLFIGNDSAPMHLAAAVGTPVVALFGPSDPKQFHPWGAPYRVMEVPLPCRPCDLVHCHPGGYPCVGNIAVDDIVAAAEELLRWSPKALPSRLMA